MREPSSRPAGSIAGATVADLRPVAGRIADLGAPGASTCLRDRLATDGLALFSGVHGRERLLDVAAGVMTVVDHPDSDASGVTVLEDLGRDGDAPNAAGFSSRELLPHTDRSGVANPPQLLATTCLHAAAQGGVCLLVDGKAVHDDLESWIPEAISALLRPGSAVFGGPAGLRTSVLTDVDEGAGRSPSSGRPRRHLRLRLDGLATFAPEVALWVPELEAAIRRHTRTVELSRGEGYVIDNHRWLHGRTAYRGPRVLLRLHGRPLPDFGFRAGIPLDRTAHHPPSSSGRHDPLPH